MHGCRQAQNLVRAFVIKTYEKRDKVMLGKNIPARDLLPGDIVCLDAGRQVPADLELISVNSLKIERSADHSAALKRIP